MASELFYDAFLYAVCVGSAFAGAGLGSLFLKLNKSPRDKKQEEGSLLFQKEMVAHEQACAESREAEAAAEEVYSVDPNSDSPWLRLLEQYGVFDAPEGAWAPPAGEDQDHDAAEEAMEANVAKCEAATTAEIATALDGAVAASAQAALERQIQAQFTGVEDNVAEHEQQDWFRYDDDSLDCNVVLAARCEAATTSELDAALDRAAQEAAAHGAELQAQDAFETSLARQPSRGDCYQTMLQAECEAATTADLMQTMDAAIAKSVEDILDKQLADAWETQVREAMQRVEAC